jgi:geranylgeranyl diphosphate synthase type II
MQMSLPEFLSQAAALVDRALPVLLPDPPLAAKSVGEAMRYAAEGGKRLRPAIAMLAAETFGLTSEVVLPTACGLECLHVATLIHDDLPCIDNDDLRRGRPTCHKAFGEAAALLAGDALLLRGLELMAEQAAAPEVCPEDALRVVREVAGFMGAHGVIGGEMADILAENTEYHETTLRFIHQHKTARLFVAAARAGAILARAEPDGLSTITAYAEDLGLLFQVTDDLLNVVGDPKKTGKAVGSDARLKKATYPALLGVAATRQRAQELRDRALDEARRLPPHQELWVALATSVAEREA